LLALHLVSAMGSWYSHMQVKVSSLCAKAAATGETRQQPRDFGYITTLDGTIPPWVADRLCCMLAEAQGDGGLRVSNFRNNRPRITELAGVCTQIYLLNIGVLSHCAGPVSDSPLQQ
jgi:hypothetical protein